MTSLDITVPVRWADLDAYGHVNNAAMLRLLEEARIEALWGVPAEQLELGARTHPTALSSLSGGADVNTVIAAQRIEYARQLDYRRDGVIVRLWVSRLGGASITVDYLVLTGEDPEGKNPYARARTVIVMLDATSGAPTRLDAASREQLAPITGEPLTFRD